MEPPGVTVKKDRHWTLRERHHVRHVAIRKTLRQQGEHDAVPFVDYDGDGQVPWQLRHLPVIQKRPTCQFLARALTVPLP